MSSLYIGGAQCVHAEFLDRDDWELFDTQNDALALLAKQFDVYVSRERIEEQGDYCFVVMNQPAKSTCFYDGAAFEVDMSVDVSDTFQSRALAYINALAQDAELSAFHNMQWSSPKVLYFVSS